jgi:hypothetical protein
LHHGTTVNVVSSIHRHIAEHLGAQVLLDLEMVCKNIREVWLMEGETCSPPTFAPS